MEETVDKIAIRAATFLCSVPDELGAVTKLEIKKGRVIARTESGTTLIVPKIPDIRNIGKAIRPSSGPDNTAPDASASDNPEAG